MPKKTVEVRTSLEDKFLVNLETRDFKLKIDQPVALGGNNEGPTPLEYFLFALGGCICSIGRIVARQKRIDLKGIDLKIEGDINSDVIMGKNKSERVGFQDIRVYIKIDAPLSKEEKEEFIKEVNSRCPISDNIENISSVQCIIE